MAKYKKNITGDFETVYNHIKRDILYTSTSSSLEEEEIITKGNIKIGILTFERYSYSGGNRLSLNVVIISENDSIDIIGTSAGGSNGLFFKFNTLGEEAFLDKLKESINKLK